MAVSPDTEPFFETEWDAAVDHSGLAHDEVYLLPVPGAPVDNVPKAAAYPRHRELEEDELLPRAKLGEANSPEARDKHRIVIFEDVDEGDPLAVAILAGKLRHELRHAEQRKACGDELFDLDGLLEAVLEWKVGGLAGGALFYTVKPIELDANAAAAAFLRERHAGLVGEMLEDEGGAALARSNTPPGALEDLPAKTVAFLFCMREAGEDWAQQHRAGIEEFVRANSRRARQLWDELCARW